MRLALVEVAAPTLAKLLMGHEMSQVTTTMPADAVIHAARWDPARQVIELAVESESFGEVPAGNMAPSFTVVVTASWTPDTAAYELLRPACSDCTATHLEHHL